MCSEICHMKCRISIQKCHSSPLDYSSYKLDSLCLILLQFFCYCTQIIAMCTFLFIDCSYSLFRGFFHHACTVVMQDFISNQLNPSRCLSLVSINVASMASSDKCMTWVIRHREVWDFTAAMSTECITG